MKKDEEKQGESHFAEGAVSILSVLRHASREIFEIFLLPEAKKEKDILKLLDLAKKRNIPIRLTDRAFFDSAATGHTHGGVIASVGEKKMVTAEEVFDRGEGFVFMLCGVEDPFNFGCAVRSFYAAGAKGMVLAPRNWLSVAGVTMRASAGCTEAILSTVCEDPKALCAIAKERGYQVVCASEKGAMELFQAPMNKPIFLIVGGEKRGISKELLSLSDYRVKIPYEGKFGGSLTTSAAAAVCAFEVLRQAKENYKQGV